jgi:hypothetical protein
MVMEVDVEVRLGWMERKESNRPRARNGPRLRVSWDCGVVDWPRGPGPKGVGVNVTSASMVKLSTLFYFWPSGM